MSAIEFSRKIIFILLYLLNITVFGQITINMPIERSVFQRINNKATIQIGGTTNSTLSEIQVKLTAIQGGTNIQWTTINTNINIGTFRSQIANVEAGWYKLELRGLNDGNQIGNVAEVSKVGVGEVFIIAGQSNAQGGRPPYDEGFFDNTFYGANDDRVNCVDFYDDSPLAELPMPIISKISAETYISPRGRASWCWAILGDQIAQNWNVPVLFFNAAETATAAKTWSNSANNGSDWPYVYLKKSLQYYGKIFGLRAVLWHQGESDLFNFNDTEYRNSIINVVNKSREHFGGNVSWMIAQVSRISDYTSNGLKDVQKEIANLPDFNAFVGPDTDAIQPAGNLRDDFVHFRGTGLIDLGFSWYNAMDQTFLNNSTPIPATTDINVHNSKFVFNNNIALSVTLKNFNYSVEEEIIKLNWKTANEFEFEGFTIEKSTNFNQFATIGQLKSNNTDHSNIYEFYDENPVEGINYFRLKMINKDGSFSYSKIIAVNLEKKEKEFKILENPYTSKNKSILILIKNIKFDSVFLTNTIGKLFEIEVENLAPNNYKLKLKEELTSGVYILNIKDQNGLNFSKKLIAID